MQSLLGMYLIAQWSLQPTVKAMNPQCTLLIQTATSEAVCSSNNSVSS